MFVAQTIVLIGEGAYTGYNRSIMAESNDGGEVIYVQFPRQSTEADTPMSEQTDNEVAVEAAELEAYNFYRDKLQQEAQQLAVQDGAPIDVNPLEITIRFQEILKLEDAIKKVPS